jgi:hypothetical protein
VLVVWEPVLPTDVQAPSSWTLRRISDLRVSQYSDRERLLSQAMGEHDRGSIVWDYIGIYKAGMVWDAGPPKAVFEGRPVVQVIGGARSALNRLLESSSGLCPKAGSLEVALWSFRASSRRCQALGRAL